MTFEKVGRYSELAHSRLHASLHHALLYGLLSSLKSIIQQTLVMSESGSGSRQQIIVLTKLEDPTHYRLWRVATEATFDVYNVLNIVLDGLFSSPSLNCIMHQTHLPSALVASCTLSSMGVEEIVCASVSLEIIIDHESQST